MDKAGAQLLVMLVGGDRGGGRGGFTLSCEGSISETHSDGCLGVKCCFATFRANVEEFSPVKVVSVHVYILCSVSLDILW